ncbi:MAG TPA: glycosyltransferase family 4 protein [Candidatus Limnocylindrales bacterium]|nr:glycosyltransferase family 4 protein [Candidatus Limnocylindrales bacterium]
MRIAQVAPLVERVPPQLYGGTERIVSYLTEELVRQGHQVTLFASGDSETRGELVAVTPRALRLDPDVIDPLAHNVLLLERVMAEADRFDIIHFHFDHAQFSMMRRLDVPSVATMHGRMDLPDLVPLFREFNDVPLVSISDAQREPLPLLNWQATVLHGLPMEAISAYPRPGSYVAFLGRISPEKGLDKAIEIARRAGMPLKIAAKVDPVDIEYFETQIRPLLTGDLEFVGEIGEDGKDDFLGGASALLFPIDWPEPFGLVMIEAAARGTPVLAFRRGSVPEVIDDGVTGMMVGDVDQAVAALPRLVQLPRERVRREIVRRFSAERMARDYMEVYRHLIEADSVSPPPALGDRAATGEGMADLPAMVTTTARGEAPADG